MATPEQVLELKTKMAEERAALIAAARALSPADALRVPTNATGEEQWTALEQLAHLWEMERSYDSFVRLALADDDADLRNAAPDPVAIPIEAANASNVDTLLRALELDRAYTLGLIDGIPLSHYERTADHPAFGRLTILQLLRSFYRHDRQHAAQIQGRVSDYTPNFKDGEPNQRQARIDLVARRQREG